jgi:Na+/melibiose symporter-like transporter
MKSLKHKEYNYQILEKVNSWEKKNHTHKYTKEKSQFHMVSLILEVPRMNPWGYMGGQATALLTSSVHLLILNRKVKQRSLALQTYLESYLKIKLSWLCLPEWPEFPRVWGNLQADRKLPIYWIKEHSQIWRYQYWFLKCSTEKVLGTIKQLNSLLFIYSKHYHLSVAKWKAMLIYTSEISKSSVCPLLIELLGSCLDYRHINSLRSDQKNLNYFQFL